ncbi:zf-HC2 domain-containing protein [Arthrobacter sp. STN4]|uniref:anti-sigma factor family protein n=1 Tax=Arthrobacter sp. STN4 TaxID=2923276 RepID=UPI002119CD34|nr:zf-HC2 domain-containing protein [Arthrobacter sp. STN4]MCQ9166072.1 zf-HC2 domain-containing protein [Arthrobacter sp. STN4]
MTTTPSAVDPYSAWDAAYVLGSLTAAERREYEQHVDGCDACRNRLAELSGLPGLLSLVGRDAVAPGAPKPLPSAAPYAVFARKVRRRRAGLAAAAAAAALVLGGGTAAVTAGLIPPAAPPATQAGHAPGRTGTAALQLTFASTGQRLLAAHGQASPEPWGTLLSWTCNYSTGTTGGPVYGNTGSPVVPTAYELVAVTTTGNRVTLATWRAAPGSKVSPVATTTLAVGSIKELLIRQQGAPATGVPLLRARL